jgi:hypothetical protein
MLVRLVMSLQVFLLLLQGMRWQLPVMADLRIGKTAENCMLAPAAETKLLREVKQLPCYDTISSRMYSRQSSSTLLKWW